MSTSQTKRRAIVTRIVALILALILVTGGLISLASCGVSSARKDAISRMELYVSKPDIITILALDHYTAEIKKAKSNAEIDKIEKEYKRVVDKILGQDSDGLVALSQRLSAEIERLSYATETVTQAWKTEFTTYKELLQKTLGALNSGADEKTVKQLLNDQAVSLTNLQNDLANARTLINTGVSTEADARKDADTILRDLINALRADSDANGRAVSDTAALLLAALDASAEESEAAIAAIEARVLAFIDRADYKYADAADVSDTFKRIGVLFDDVHLEIRILQRTTVTKTEFNAELDRIEAKFDAVDELIKNTDKELREAISAAKGEAMDYTDAELAAAIEELKEYSDNNLLKAKAYTNAEVYTAKTAIMNELLAYVKTTTLNDKLAEVAAVTSGLQSQINSIKENYAKKNDFDELKNEYEIYIANNDREIERLEGAIDTAVDYLEEEIGELKEELNTAILNKFTEANEHTDSLVGAIWTYLGVDNGISGDFLDGRLEDVYNILNTLDESISNYHQTLEGWQSSIEDTLGEHDTAIESAQTDILALQSFKNVVENWGDVPGYFDEISSWMDDIFAPFAEAMTALKDSLAALDQLIIDLATDGIKNGSGVVLVPPLRTTLAARNAVINQSYAYSAEDFALILGWYDAYDIAVRSARADDMMSAEDKVIEAYEILQANLEGAGAPQNQYDDVILSGYYALENEILQNLKVAASAAAAVSALETALTNARTAVIGASTALVGKDVLDGATINDGVVSLNKKKAEDPARLAALEAALCGIQCGDGNERLGLTGYVVNDIAYISAALNGLDWWTADDKGDMGDEITSAQNALDAYNEDKDNSSYVMALDSALYTLYQAYGAGGNNNITFETYASFDTSGSTVYDDYAYSHNEISFNLYMSLLLDGYGSYNYQQ